MTRAYRDGVFTFAQVTLGAWLFAWAFGSGAGIARAVLS